MAKTVLSDPAEAGHKLISVSEAVKRGYASRATINRWIDLGHLVSTYISGHRYVRLSDIEGFVRLRQEGIQPTIDTSQEVNRLCDRIAALMPVLTAGQKDQISKLLASDGAVVL